MVHFSFPPSFPSVQPCLSPARTVPPLCSLLSKSSPGWAQFADVFNPDGWHDQNNTATQTKTLTFTFPQLGWEPNEPWYQLNLGANSDTAVPVGFYLDNVKLTVVPEPSTVSLGILAISLFFARRRAA